MTLDRRFLGLTLAALLAACSGEDGAVGPQGPAGQDGATGDEGPQGPQGPAAGYIALEVAGVVGLVTDTSGAAVTGGTVYFVPAADVAALETVTMPVPKASLGTDPNVDRDEPLEDLVRLNGATYPSAAVGTDGVYRLATLAAGSYFVTFVPADDAHLPGGSLCRVARPSDALVGTRLDLEVSPAIPGGAHFVGSSTCISCHGRAHISSTMHRLGIWSPYEAGVYQNVRARWGDLYQALESEFVAGTPNTVDASGVETAPGTGGTRVYFYDYDGARGFDKYKTARDAAPATATSVSFSVRVYAYQDQYWVEFRNEDATAPAASITRRVDTVYGGGVGKQRYQTKVYDAATGEFRYSAMLPLQFNSVGVEGSAGGRPRTAQVWRDYYGANWYDRTAKAFVVPAASKSFEKNCISCHAAGVQVTGSDATTWTASLIADPLYGDFDYDGDGVKDEVNAGCETCHGPGSRHWESAGRGKHIVSPSLLTPEREAMICGQCHSRPQGSLGTDSPVNAAGWMMVAGTSRAEFLAEYATTQGDGKASDFWGDQNGNHSKSHHQQYSDFIRSAMYRNGTELMTCASCHDPHRRDNPRQMRVDQNDNLALCGSCHATQSNDLGAHLTAKVGYVHTEAVLCTDCHMPKTAQSGAGAPPDGGDGITGAVSGTKYWWGDISSHKFDVPRKAASRDSTPAGMPSGYTNSCVSCHSGAGL